MTKLQNALTRVLDELERILKKGKSSKFDGRKDRQVDSGLALTVQTHKDLVLDDGDGDGGSVGDDDDGGDGDGDGDGDDGNDDVDKQVQAMAEVQLQ